MIRRFLRALGTALMVAGVALVIDAALTVMWQEPFSAAYTRVVQGNLDDQLATLDEAAPGKIDQAALAALTERDQKIAYAARSVRRKVPEGDPIARITIPKIDVAQVVINGTSTADLRKGPGLIESTDLPGMGGTTGIAGHRTTYGAPFHSINNLAQGTRIYVGTPYGRFEYAVERQRIVTPTDVWVLARIGRERLVLSACHPLYSAARRIIVFAKLVGYTPPKAGPWAELLAGTGGGLSARP